MVMMKMMVIAKDERIVEVFDSSELPGASDTFSVGFILFFFFFYIVKTVSYMSHHLFVHIFTYQTYLQGGFSLFSEEEKQSCF